MTKRIAFTALLAAFVQLGSYGNSRIERTSLGIGYTFTTAVVNYNGPGSGVVLSGEVTAIADGVALEFLHVWTNGLSVGSFISVGFPRDFKHIQTTSFGDLTAEDTTTGEYDISGVIGSGSILAGYTLVSDRSNLFTIMAGGTFTLHNYNPSKPSTTNKYIVSGFGFSIYGLYKRYLFESFALGVSLEWSSTTLTGQERSESWVDTISSKVVPAVGITYTFP